MPTKHGESSSEKQVFIAAEGQQESGGDYSVTNPGSGALGKWQVMPANLPGWARECGLPVVSPSYFLSHPDYQDKMAECILGGYYDKYGPRGAASMWYSGQPDWHATYGDPPVYQYVNDVIALMNDPNLPPVSGGGAESGTNPIVSAPTDVPDDWSARISRSAERYNDAGNALLRYSQAIDAVRQ